MLLWGVGIGLVSDVADMLSSWITSLWTALAQGWSTLPTDFLWDSIFLLVQLSLIAGPVVLISWHLFRLLAPKRRSPSVVLWLSSALFGLVLCAVSAFELYFAFSGASVFWPSPTRREVSLSDFDWFELAYIFLTPAIGLLITLLGFRAWGRRRRANRTTAEQTEYLSPSH